MRVDFRDAARHGSDGRHDDTESDSERQREHGVHAAVVSVFLYDRGEPVRACSRASRSREVGGGVADSWVRPYLCIENIELIHNLV